LLLLLPEQGATAALMHARGWQSTYAALQQQRLLLHEQLLLVCRVYAVAAVPLRPVAGWLRWHELLQEWVATS
jgi:hypothetical protein